MSPDLSAFPTSDRPSPTVERMLHLAGASPAWRVGVVGPASAAALIALCRRGYDRALAVASGVCASEGDCDLLLVTGPLSREGLQAAVRSGLPLLRPGGVLAVHESGLADDGLIRATLRTAGREAGWCVHDLAEACLAAMEVLRPAAEPGLYVRAA
jgi:hypothetical protein